MQNSQLNQELIKFELLIKKLGQKYKINEVCKDAYVLSPNDDLSHPKLKKIPLAFMALTHGIEVASLAILNEFLLYLLESSHYKLQFSLAIILGNTEAALCNKRFIEKDLNRCFGSNSNDTLEEKRAKELESIFSDISYLIDFHQTILPNQEPFFIFPYSKKGFSFAKKIAPNQAIVTHWKGAFSAEGMCTDEYLNKLGGAGITIETGQCGFDSYQIGYGFFITLRACSYIERLFDSSKNLDNENDPLNLSKKIFTWAEIKKYPNAKDVQLSPGLFNFKYISKDTILGQSDGVDIKASMSGYILFPKYVTKNQKRPTELYRILKTIDESVLPQG